MKMRLLILSILFVLIIGCSEKDKFDVATVTSDKFIDIKKTINEKIDKGDIPSVTVAVMKDGNIIWMESFGYADKENKIYASPNTMYSIASISKAMTATGVMALAEQGKIDLDSNISCYLDSLELRYYTESPYKVTCRHLLSHTSGLPMHFQYFYDDKDIPIPDIVDIIEQYGIILNPPSTKYVYANLGYGILGEIISRVSGKSFKDYMQEDVFSPLGMAHTTLDMSAKTKNKLAKRYDILGDLLPFSFSDTPGAGNISTTIKDLLRLGDFHLGHANGAPLLSTQTIQAMQTGQYPDNSGERNTYGLGWFTNDTDYKYKMVYHAGGMDGVDAMIRLIPEKNIVVAAISNQYTEFTHSLTEDILLEMLPDLKTVEKNIEQDNVTKDDIEIIEESDLLGSWEGFIVANGKHMPIDLIFQEDGDIQVNMYAQFESMMFQTHRYRILHSLLLNKWSSANGQIRGWYNETIPGDHLLRCPHITNLNLEYKNGKLIGTAVAMALDPRRMHYGISHYTEFKKYDNE